MEADPESAAGKTERFVNGLARGPMMFRIMVKRVVELLDATVLPNEYDDDPEAEAAFDAAAGRANLCPLCPHLRPGCLIC